MKIHELNFPDVLGYITGGQRQKIGVMHAALAIEPEVAFVGRTFEAVLLLQNTTSVGVKVQATMEVPETTGQRRRFVSSGKRSQVGVRPGEVGALVFQVHILPGVAPGKGYKIGMDINVLPDKKAVNVRPNNGGHVLTADELRALATGEQVEALKQLRYSVQKRGLLSAGLEAPFTVMSSQTAQPPHNLKPEWYSLWTPRDYRAETVADEPMPEQTADPMLELG
jgi:hypothetical protein